MKTLYLHVGTPKTGTCAIQELCTLNQGLLNSQDTVIRNLRILIRDLERDGMLSFFKGQSGKTECGSLNKKNNDF